MSSTDGLKRGMEITDVGGPISVPVGEAVMGRVFDVTGNAVEDSSDRKNSWSSLDGLFTTSLMLLTMSGIDGCAARNGRNP